MDTLLTLRRPIKVVKPRKIKLLKVKKGSVPPPTNNSLRKKKKQMESGAAPTPVGFGSFVALYREACAARWGGYHHSPSPDDAELPRAPPGSFALSIPPIPSLGGGDARRPLVHVVMEMDY